VRVSLRCTSTPATGIAPESPDSQLNSSATCLQPPVVLSLPDVTQPAIDGPVDMVHRGEDDEVVRSTAWRGGFALAVLIAFGSSAVGVPDASANWAGHLSEPCEYELIRRCFADTAVHTWDHDNLPTRFTQALVDTLEDSYETTDLRIDFLDEGHTTSVDVWYNVVDLPDRPIGQAVCWGGNGTERCTHWHVSFEPQNSDFTDQKLQAVACHETGHTVGLNHPQNQAHGWLYNDDRFACMRTEGHQPFGWDQALGAHNASHIDGFYNPP